MDINPDIANWILEYFIRKRIDDRTLNFLLRALPLSKDNRNLQKLLLLKKLESEVSESPVSESALELLEQLEEIEFQGGNEAVSDAMKQAYCAAAVDCTLGPLRVGGDDNSVKNYKLFDIVKRLWRGKIDRMKKHATSGLCSEALWVWKDAIEAAVWDDSVLEHVLTVYAGVRAVDAVRIYLREEKEKIGPSFLEVLAERVKNGGYEQKILGVNDLDIVAVEETPSPRDDPVANGSNGMKEMPWRKANIREKLIIGMRRTRKFAYGTSRGTGTVDSDKMTSAEVDKTREALDSSLLELQASLKNPLPDPLLVAEAISSKARQNKRQDPAEGNDGRSKVLILDVDGVVQSSGGNVNNVSKPTEAMSDKAIKNKRQYSAEGNDGGPKLLILDAAGVGQSNGGNMNNVPKPSLMDRNSSARTFEWDDSIDRSQKDLACRAVVQLPSPKRINTSPSNIHGSNNVKKRRKARKWSLMEEDALRDGVEKYGKGNWKLILTLNRDIFEGRTDVDLKDKWRNLTK